MLQCPWACNLTVFGHVPHHDDGQVGVLGHPNQGGSHFPDLGNAAGGAVQNTGGHGLDGVDNQQFWVDLVNMPEDSTEICFVGEEKVVIETVGPRRAQIYLSGGLFRADIEDPLATLSRSSCNIKKES